MAKTSVVARERKREKMVSQYAAKRAELKKAGSSMDKVLKVNVYLHDIKDYAAMNEAYRGRFGSKPPVRTTIAVYGGVPGSSLVEMDAIAAL